MKILIATGVVLLALLTGLKAYEMYVREVRIETARKNLRQQEFKKQNDIDRWAYKLIGEDYLDCFLRLRREGVRQSRISEVC